ncbi:hypothetical protein P5X00_40135 (plasmid) [Paraburkholderia sp. A2RO-4L]|uniref:hypothetical protein n=1 Tax=Paraburkholderia sp. A2RO-4L TaxID=3028374 RepID=UPI003DA96240
MNMTDKDFVESASNVIACEVERSVAHRLYGLGFTGSLPEAESMVLKAAVILAVQSALNASQTTQAATVH